MTEEEAKKRFMLLNAIRFAALAMIALAIANIAGKFVPSLSPWLGYFLLLIGAFDYFYVPMILKKAWAKQDQ